MAYSYTATHTDATNVGNRMQTAENAIGGTPTLPSPVVSNDNVAFLKARADALLLSFGHQAYSEAASLGSTSTSSTTYVDIGDGAATGFSTFAWTAPVAKTYVVQVAVDGYLSVLGANGFLHYRLLVDGSEPAGHPTAENRFAFSEANVRRRITFSVPVLFTAAAHTLKLQWKVGDAGSTANVNSTFEMRSLRITG